MENSEDWRILIGSFKQGGWLAITGAVTTTVIRIFSSDWFQGLLAFFIPKKYLWASWNDWAKRLALFLFAALGGVLTAVAGGMQWGLALASVIPTAFSAHILHTLAEKKTPQITIYNPPSLP